MVNPIACILSAAMMLRYTFGMAAEADAIENAVNAVLDGLRTADMMADGCTKVGCTAMGDPFGAHLIGFTGVRFYSFFEKKEPKKTLII